jgi:hypothetical protein
MKAKNDAICKEWLRRLSERPDLSTDARAWAKKEARTAIECLLTADYTSKLGADARARSEWEILASPSVVVALEDLELLTYEGIGVLLSRHSQGLNRLDT